MLGLKEFDKFNDQYNNRFLSTMLIAKQARQNASECNYVIRDSEALTWAITGIEPKHIDNEALHELQKMNSPEDILNYVSDNKLVQSVQQSLKESKNIHKLLYVYNDLTEEEQIRVKVLTNLIWKKYTWE